MTRRGDVANGPTGLITRKVGVATALVLALLSACDPSYPSSAWGDAGYDHETLSGGFQLLGVHVGAPCTSCHAVTDYQPLFQASSGNDCLACHLGEYERRHADRGFPTTCTLCHSPTVWADGSFHHPTLSAGFELLGVHRSLSCLSCHEVGTFEPLFDVEQALACAACHAGGIPANHSQRAFPPDCALCHTATAWANGTFDHLATSGAFDLLGIHVALSCGRCHTPGTFEARFDPEDATDCVTCHLARYEQAHGGTGYPTVCVACHTPTFWQDGTFDHAGISGGFELVGSHAELACFVCHDPGSFEPLFDPEDNDDCVACHQDDYDGQHSGSGFPLTCASCHSPTVWRDAEFDHASTSGGFELEGVHDGMVCTACHDPATFIPLQVPSDQDDCVACHRAEFDSEHGSAGYPTTCRSCHQPTFWQAVDFDHDRDFFPIYTGEHSGRWSTCATCHTNPADFSEFTCFTCHVHNETAMNNRHRGRDGYSYVPAACLSCHPTGDSD